MRWNMGHVLPHPCRKAQPGQSAEKSLKAEMQEFCEKKGRYIPELSDGDWVADVVIAVDVTPLMKELS